MKNAKIYSAYWDNIDPVVLEAQKNVFQHFDLNLLQINTKGEPHGQWMTRIARSIPDDEIVIFCDIDAFPLNGALLPRAIEAAIEGRIFGMAQVANHLDPCFLYAAPSFLSFSKQTYKLLGEPSLCHTEMLDPAQLLTQVAIDRSTKIEMLYPRSVIIPKWPLADIGVFGIGTFYGENDLFHLFESRFSLNIKILEAVSKDVVNSKLNFAKYLEISRSEYESPRKKRSFWNLFKKNK